VNDKNLPGQIKMTRFEADKGPNNVDIRLSRETERTNEKKERY
jgi:hypothetical protein